MNNLYYYRAFGMNISSEIKISMLDETKCDEIDVKIVKKDLSVYKDKLHPDEYVICEKAFTFLYVPKAGNFLITDGNTISVDSVPEVPDGLLAVYIMGSCFGAIIHQRGMLPLHGSCVARGGEAILITGDSGAGKSTLAAEFLKQGWKLLTDDVAVVTGIEEGCPMVTSSYASQKLWQDAIERMERTEETMSLYQEERREKYGIKVNDYIDSKVQLKKIVRLIPSESDVIVDNVEGFTKVDQLMANTYRAYMILEEDRNRHFQRCVTLSSLIEMLVAVRASDRNSTEELYEQIVNFGKRND